MTNLALFGYATDTKTSPLELFAAQAHLGQLAAHGNPARLGPGRRAHADQALRRRCSPGTGVKGADGTEWYFPQRLTIDTGAVGPATPTRPRRSSTCARRTATSCRSGC